VKVSNAIMRYSNKTVSAQSTGIPTGKTDKVIVKTEGNQVVTII
jgi:hypothetical protein